MRLFGYYALHTFKNQLKKLFKSWVLIFILACALMGGLIGFGAGTLANKAEEQNALEAENETPGTDPAATEEAEVPADASEDEDAEGGIQDAPSIDEILNGQGVTKKGVIELVCTAILLLILILSVIGADKNGSRIFQPADVNLLFASPMRPQSVLMFRLMTQIGLAIFLGIYLLLQLPNLVTFGLTVPQGIAIIVALALAVLIGTLFKVLIYTASSSHPNAKKTAYTVIWTVIFVLAALYAQHYLRFSGLLESADKVFNHPASRWVPFIGWLKGFIMGAVEGNISSMLIFLGLVLGGIALLIVLIWRMDADFYEDAMAKSQELADAMEAARASRAGIAFTKRKKDRADTLRRDGLNHGAGASVFFHKTLYNRFRFAKFGIFTKTAVTYLITAVLVTAFCRFVIEKNGFIALMLILGVMVFYRSLGNSYDSDIKMSHFILIPDSTFRKLMYSLLGSTANTFLDILPAAIVAVIAMPYNPLKAVFWVLFVVTVDLYATVTGAFIGLSTPQNAGATVKQIVQVMFLYFGLLPDVAILAVGLVMHHTAAALAIASAVNVLLALFFLALCPLLIDPPEKAARIRNTNEADPRAAAKVFSRIGFGLFVMFGLTMLVQVAAGALMQRFTPDFLQSPAAQILLSAISLYVIGIPAGFLVIRKVPSAHAERPFPKGHLIPAFFIGVFLFFGANILSLLLGGLIGRIAGTEATTPVAQLIMDMPLWVSILYFVLIAPVMEEFLFRKVLIDRTRQYGERLAVVFSAFCFGAFHGNLQQFCYAFAMGLVFGYVYLRMGKVRYTAAMHMIVNLFGSVIAPYLLKTAGESFEGLSELDLTAPDPAMIGKLMTPGLIGLGFYYILIVISMIAGLIFLIVYARRVTFMPSASPLPRKTAFKTTILTAGMLLFIALCILNAVLVGV